MSSFKIFAHRGGMGHGPENALSTIEKSLAVGVEAIEIDLWCVDNELFVVHDRRLGRTVEGKGRIFDYSAEQLHAMTLENGETIATLQDVLTLVDGRAEINLELKGSTAAELLHQQLEAYIGDSKEGSNQKRSYEQFLVSSFDHHQLSYFKQHCPQVRRGVLLGGIPLDYAACADDLDAHSIHLSLSFLTPEFVRDAHRRGLKVFVYTVNTRRDMLDLIALGVDGIFTDFPEKAMQLRKTHI